MGKSISEFELSVIFPEFNNSGLLKKIRDNASLKSYAADYQFFFTESDHFSFSFCYSGIIEILRKLPNGKYLFLYNFSKGDWCNNGFFNRYSK